MIRNNAHFFAGTAKMNKGRVRGSGKKLNERFLEYYLETDRLCSMKFGRMDGGITEYIKRLSDARQAKDRDDVLSRLTRYRNVRNSFVHEPGALKRVGEVSRLDVKWLKKFNKQLIHKKDSLTVYLRHSRKRERVRRLKWILCLFGFFTATVLAVILYFVLQNV